MGYRVVYGNDRQYSVSGGIRVGRAVVLSIVAGTMFLSAAYRYWPDCARVMDRLLRYEGWSETREALEMMAVQLRSGTGLREAVTAFCRDIVSVGLTYAA